MKFKNINLSKETITGLIALGVIIGIDRGCSSHEKVDTTELKKEIAAAKTSLDSVAALQGAAVAKRDMYRHKCDSLCPVVGVHENPSVRARKNVEWRQYRDSVYKYGDEATVQEIARGWAQLRVDTLESKLRMIELRYR